MSPVPMMNECSTPTVYLLAQVLECIRILRKKGKHIPDIIMAGGFVNETQIFKAIAMSNLGDGNGPYVKAVAMARAPIAAVMKSDYFVELSKGREASERIQQALRPGAREVFLILILISKSSPFQ